MMKKIVFCLFAVLVFASCVDSDPIDNTGGPLWVNKSLEVLSRDWVREGDLDDYGSYYYADFYIPELDWNIFKEGAVMMYIQSDPANPNYKSVMPMNVYSVEKVNNVDYYWTTSYDYDFWEKGVRVYCKYSDFFTGLHGRPGREVFHLVLIY